MSNMWFTLVSDREAGIATVYSKRKKHLTSNQKLMNFLFQVLHPLYHLMTYVNSVKRLVKINVIELTSNRLCRSFPRLLGLGNP